MTYISQGDTDMRAVEKASRECCEGSLLRVGGRHERTNLAIGLEAIQLAQYRPGFLSRRLKKNVAKDETRVWVRRESVETDH